MTYNFDALWNLISSIIFIIIFVKTNYYYSFSKKLGLNRPHMKIAALAYLLIAVGFFIKFFFYLNIEFPLFLNFFLVPSILELLFFSFEIVGFYLIYAISFKHSHHFQKLTVLFLILINTFFFITLNKASFYLIVVSLNLFTGFNYIKLEKKSLGFAYILIGISFLSIFYGSFYKIDLIFKFINLIGFLILIFILFKCNRSSQTKLIKYI